MFKEILDKYQLDPTNCVFLDDIEGQYKRIQNLGIKRHQVKKEVMSLIFRNFIFKGNALLFL